ncbi:tetratricopeptide repeat protein [Leptolyngbya sp. BC1307]|uniref:tetratricopeptide repeat protein n=1 Tax=Leptolyngbya sp. BC1307 TaxID=2029589 RepID=UPI000EFD4B16|nr:tetratricopeptide repeat protein [Leptolyngbya sp. BC1307]
MLKPIKKILAFGIAPALFGLLTGSPLTASAQTSPSPTPEASTEIYATPEQEYDEYMRLGFAAQQAGNYADAATSFRYALYAVPNDREATIAYWNAVDELQSDEASGQSSAYEQAMDQGYDATEKGDYAAALASFQTALQQRPEDYYAAQAVRNVQTYLSRGTEADSPTDVPLTYRVYAGETAYDRYMRLGYAAAKREDLSAAITYFRSALYEQSNDRQATIAYWNAVDGLQDGEFGLGPAAEAGYDRYMRLGYDATNRGSYARALDFFEKAIAERPQDDYAAQAIRNVRTYMSESAE